MSTKVPGARPQPKREPLLGEGRGVVNQADSDTDSQKQQEAPTFDNPVVGGKRLRPSGIGSGL